MTKEELAAKITGSEYPFRVPRELLSDVKVAGLVVVYGASDDLMEFEGAIDDEFGCYDGGTALVDKQGFLPDWDSVSDDEDEAQKYFERKPHVKPIRAIWGEGGYAWTYETEIPHVTFEVVEDGEPYCRGIIFSVADL